MGNLGGVKHWIENDNMATGGSPKSICLAFSIKSPTYVYFQYMRLRYNISFRKELMTQKLRVHSEFCKFSSAKNLGGT